MVPICLLCYYYYFKVRISRSKQLWNTKYIYIEIKLKITPLLNIHLYSYSLLWSGMTSSSCQLTLERFWCVTNSDNPFPFMTLWLFCRGCAAVLLHATHYFVPFMLSHDISTHRAMHLNFLKNMSCFPKILPFLLLVTVYSIVSVWI